MNMSKRDEGSANITPDDWERIARYLTGEAGSGEAEATERWVEADPHRVEIVQLLESVLANVAREDSAEIDLDGALKNVKSRFDDSKVIPFTPRMATGTDRSFVALLRIAAAAIVIVGGTMLWQRVRGSHGDAGQTFATSVGERRQIVLRDGTKVLIGPTSRLKVFFGDQDGDRLVSLEGVAYFSVVHDAAHPFTVKAGSFRIQDAGTTFAVESDDSAGTRVVVDSGSVAVGAANQYPDASSAVLNARDRATVDMKGIVVVERSAVSDDDLAWIQGRLVFRDAPLILVGAELYRWYGVRLRVADSSLANLHLTASFSGEPVDRVLNVIALSLGARIERQGNVAILHRAAPSGARP
jgi:transmembrane sensor